MGAYPDEYAALKYIKEHTSEEPKQLAKSCVLFKMSSMIDNNGVQGWAVA